MVWIRAVADEILHDFLKWCVCQETVDLDETYKQHAHEHDEMLEGLIRDDLWREVCCQQGRLGIVYGPSRY